MAALGKIRSKSVALIAIIGFGLFAFIAEEAFRSCESSRNNERQQIGSSWARKISTMTNSTNFVTKSGTTSYSIVSLRTSATNWA